MFEQSLFSLSGTDTTTMTFPSTSATIARTDSAQTFTGVQTLSSQPILSSLTASQAVFTDGSKGLVSNAITGSGNVVMSASPTLTGTIAGASQTLSGTLGVTGRTTLINASTTQLSVTNRAWFGGTATSTFTSAGRLGILTASPSYPLDVTGDINIST